MLTSLTAANRAGVTDGRIRQVAYDQNDPDEPAKKRAKLKRPDVLLPGWKVKGDWRFSVNGVEEWMRQRLVTDGSSAGHRTTAPPSTGGLTVETLREPLDDIRGSVKAMSDRLRFVETRLKSLGESAAGTTPPPRRSDSEPNSPRQAAEDARGRAMDHLLEAIKEMDAADRFRVDELNQLLKDGAPPAR